MGITVLLLGIGGAIANSITNCALKIGPYTKEQRDHVNKLGENKKKLHRAAKRMNAKKQDIEEKIEEHIITKKTTHEWDAWVESVKEIVEDVKHLEATYKKAKRLRHIMCSFLSRAKLSVDMETKAEEIDSLVNKMNCDIAMVDKKLVTSAGRSFGRMAECSWVRNNVDRILEFLRQENVKRVGIWAFAGMGKTTIMRGLNDKARETGLFDHVIFVTLEERDTEEKICKSILEHLNLKLNAGEYMRSAHHIALTISRALESKKYLLVLDQVFQEIDLKELGIYDHHSGGKVVVATRYKAVCDKMDMEDSWELDQMSEVDALMLFRKIAGEGADYVRNRREAELIVKECGGVPLLINAVATYLKSEQNDHVWSDCLFKLQSSTYDDLEPFSESCNVFKLVYDRLSDSRKKCFLYGALYPQDHEIYEDHLMECWRAEQFIPATGGNNDRWVFRRARQEGHATMKCLVNACLLKRCRNVKYVCIPNLFRTWALKTDEGVSSLVNPSNGVHKCQNPIWVSLKSNNLNTSLEQVNFNMVSTLFLQRNNGRLEEILDPLFLLKSKLRVLDLGYTGIKSLPSSISNLTNLKALYLNNCSELDQMPANITELKHVEILDICRTGISHWPCEIGKMAGLRCLRVSFIRNVGPHQSSKIIGKLLLLEELTIVVDEVYQNQWNTIVLELTQEVAGLKFLTTLRIYFPSMKCLKAFIDDSKSWNCKETQWGENTFRSFRIVVGSFWRDHEVNMIEHKAERHLKFFAYNESSLGDGCSSTISEVLKQACTFELIGHGKIEHLSTFGVDSMAGLKVCTIKDCNEMRSIISGSNEGTAALKELKQLHLINLRKLAIIYEGLIGDENFTNLTTLIINNCPELSAILSCEMIERITLLEHLRVENCSKVTVIIGGGNQDRNNPTHLLPRLKSLELINLSMLQNICLDDTGKWSSLREIKIDECMMLKSLPLSLNNAENLRLIKCHESLWNKLNLVPDVRSRFRPFCQFISQVEINIEEIR